MQNRVVRYMFKNKKRKKHRQNNKPHHNQKLYEQNSPQLKVGAIFLTVQNRMYEQYVCNTSRYGKLALTMCKKEVLSWKQKKIHLQ